MEFAISIMSPPLDYSFSSNIKRNHIYPTDHCQALPQNQFLLFYRSGSLFAPVGAEWAQLLSWASFLF